MSQAKAFFGSQITQHWPRTGEEWQMALQLLDRLISTVDSIAPQQHRCRGPK